MNQTENGHIPFEMSLAKAIKDKKVDMNDIDMFGFEKQKVLLFTNKI